MTPQKLTQCQVLMEEGEAGGRKPPHEPYKRYYQAATKIENLIKNIGTWRSLVACYLGVVEVAGSNPVVPIFFIEFLV